MALDENLNIYICPSQLYLKKVGFISEMGEFIITDDEWYRAIYKRKACMENCCYAPICFGGCLMNDNFSCRKKQIEERLPHVLEYKIRRKGS